jgi:hypothetical protein
MGLVSLEGPDETDQCCRLPGVYKHMNFPVDNKIRIAESLSLTFATTSQSRVPHLAPLNDGTKRLNYKSAPFYTCQDEINLTECLPVWKSPSGFM